MVLWMDRETATFTHMGAEGVTWVGQAPFTNEKHVFANLGDGTYFHSGLLAIRAAVAAKVNITYKILYNDAVAMTGGQPFDGPLDPGMISRQIAAEGVAPDHRRHRRAGQVPGRLRLGRGRHRAPPQRAGRDVQRELREVPGRVGHDLRPDLRLRKTPPPQDATNIPDPAKRVVINEAVCEGCGDCCVQSNCLSVEPLETEFGRKRQINQSSCNKDYSCVNGFCPSFVTVEGGAAEEAEKGGAGRSAIAGRRSRRTVADAGLADDSTALRHPGHRHRRHRRRHRRPDPGDGGARRRQGRARCST